MILHRRSGELAVWRRVMPDPTSSQPTGRSAAGLPQWVRYEESRHTAAQASRQQPCMPQVQQGVQRELQKPKGGHQRWFRLETV